MRQRADMGLEQGICEFIDGGGKAFLNQRRRQRRADLLRIQSGRAVLRKNGRGQPERENTDEKKPHHKPRIETERAHR
ncbi:hypothetical protein D9M73_143650 [compost metagenome]